VATAVLDHAPRADEAVARPGVHRGAERGVTPRLAVISLIVFTVVGAVARAPGLSNLGLWRDDAWVGLSSKVGLGTAWHMWVTAPGFYAMERTVMVLDPGSAEWAQLLPFLLGLAAISTMYGLARAFSLSRRAGLVLAFLVCVSPVAIMYSTRIKEYGADFLLSCLILGLGEAARRQGTARCLHRLAAASVLGFLVSASVGPEIAAVWLALVLLRRPRPDLVRSLLPSLAATGMGCALVAAAFYRHLSPFLTKFWSGSYITHTSVTAGVDSLAASVWRLERQLFDLPGRSAPLSLFIFVGLNGLIVLGAGRGRAMVVPALALAGAVATSVLGLMPLGTGRTDEYLYPAILLLAAAGLGRVIGLVGPLVSRPTRWAGVALAGLAVAGCVSGMISSIPSYPGVNVIALAALVHQHELPGDHIVVDELMRYSWALYQDPRPHVVIGPDWSTGFTVVSTAPDTFIVPSEYYEGGSDPARWAAAMTRYRRLWFVETPPLALSPTYAALLHDGWRPTGRVSASGCAAILLERPTAS